MGQSVVEFALILPIFLILIAGAIDLGRLFYAYVAITNASKEGALYGASNPLCRTEADCQDPLNVVWHVRSEAGNLTDSDGKPLTPTIACVAPGGGTVAEADCHAGYVYQVSVSYQFRLITPILGTILDRRLVLRSEAHATVLNAAVDPNPGLSVTKTVLNPKSNDYERSPVVDPETGVPKNLELTVGDQAKYQITVLNSGGTTLTGLTYDDDAVSGGWPTATPSCPPRKSVLASGGSYTCRYSVSLTKAQTDLRNTVTVSGDGLAPVTDVSAIDVVAAPPRLEAGKDVSVYRNQSPFGFDNELTVARSGTLNPIAWFRIRVTNTGGQPATGMTITDSTGPLPITADCPRPPSTLQPNASYACFYSRPFAKTGTFENIATIHSKETGDQKVEASVSVESCSAPNLVVPNLVEEPNGHPRTVGEARALWAASGFVGTFNPAGSSGADVTGQNQTPFDCRTPTITVRVTHN